MDYWDDKYELRGLFTEDEIDAGIAWIYFGHDKQSSDVEDRKDALMRLPDSAGSARLKDAARIVAGLKDQSAIKDKLVQRLMREESDASIARYLKRECIPSPYHALIRQRDCIEILVRGIFYKVAKLKRNAALNEDITLLCASLKVNDQEIIAYERVGALQRFVHEKLRLHGDDRIVERFPVEPMRCLLSMARLHLNLLDLEAVDPSYVVRMTEESNMRAALEFANPSPPPLLSEGKRVFPRWRVRHMKPLSYYFESDTRKRLAALLNVDITLKLNVFIEEACEAFAYGGGNIRNPFGKPSDHLRTI